MKETMITRINDVAIAATSNEQGEVLIPIRPICDALGVNSNGQIEKIKSDPILGATDKLAYRLAQMGGSAKWYVCRCNTSSAGCLQSILGT